MFALVPSKPSVAVNFQEKVKPAGLTCFFRASVAVDSDAVLKIKIHPNQASNAVQPQIETNAWAILPQDSGCIAAGEKIQFITNGAGV